MKAWAVTRPDYDVEYLVYLVRAVSAGRAKRLLLDTLEVELFRNETAYSELTAKRMPDFDLAGEGAEGVSSDDREVNQLCLTFDPNCTVHCEECGEGTCYADGARIEEEGDRVLCSYCQNLKDSAEEDEDEDE